MPAPPSAATLDATYLPRPFDPATSPDPEPHEVINRYLETAINKWGDTYRVNGNPENAKELLRKDEPWNRRVLLALAEQALHLLEDFRRWHAGLEDHERSIFNYPPSGRWINARSRIIYETSKLLMRRRLKLSPGEAARVVRAAREKGGYVYVGLDGAGAVKQAEKVAEFGPLGDELRDALEDLSARRSASPYPEPEIVARIARLLYADSGGSPSDLGLPAAIPAPAPVGSSLMLTDLKLHLGMIQVVDVPDAETHTIGPDAFPLRRDSPLRVEHEAVSQMLEQGDRLRAGHWGVKFLESVEAAATLVQADPTTRAAVYLASCERHASCHLRAGGFNDGDFTRWAGLTAKLTHDLGTLDRDFTREGAFDAMLHDSSVGYVNHQEHGQKWAWRLEEKNHADGDLTPGERYVLHRLRCFCFHEPPMGVLPDAAATYTRLIDGEGVTLLLVPGEHWADRVHTDLAAMTVKQRAAWVALLRHAVTATASKPSGKWAKGAATLVKAIRPATLRDRLAQWLPLVAKGRAIKTLGGGADTFNDGNADVLRGLVWTLTPHADAATPRLLADLLTTSIKKIPGVGPRCVKLANACVWVLGELAASKDDATRDAALGQLARLKARITFRTTLIAIDKAFNKAAEKAGMSREDLEELGVPAFGFESGVRHETFGDEGSGAGGVTLRVEGNSVTTAWTNAAGKSVKSPPAAVKRDYKDDVKEITAAAKDAEGILLAGRDRLDNIYLHDKSWPLAAWRERFLDHGLLGTLARRLIWTIGDASVLYQGDSPLDINGDTIEPPDDAPVRLWHPIHHTPEEVLAWRDRLVTLNITQPFKQAHREVYPLTDAERNTGTYSNRFAAHIVRQHQFNALCAARGWRNTLRLMVDDSYPPPYRELPAFGLRAEFWVEGIGDDYGGDTTDSGAYLHLATDQVRFYQTSAAPNSQHAGGGGYTTQGPEDERENHPLSLADIPPLVLSEILRDCDLFVGVASVGNDPNWADGGPQGRFVRFHQYWHDTSFGDLSQTAQTRREVLARLVPRLHIADRCEIGDRFLTVRGTLAHYQIHLGSGNIQILPDHQYLCIVPNQGRAADEDNVTLPFEGDRTLSIILSKAFLLADDKNIRDPTILSQIRRSST